MFKTHCNAGSITVVALDAAGHEVNRSELHSASGTPQLTAAPETDTIKAGGIAYIPVTIQGANGVVESNADRKLTATAIGGTLLGFGSASPCTKERYDSESFTTYQGRALAIVRGDEPGEIKLTVSDGKQSATA